MKSSSFTFTLKGHTLWLLFSMSKPPPSLLWYFQSVIISKSRTSTFSHKGHTLCLLFGISKLPVSLVFHYFQSIVSENQGYLNTSTYNTVTVDLITEMATKWLTGGWRTQCGHTGERDDSRDSCPGWGGQDGLRFHHDTQKNAQFKTDGLFPEFFIYHFQITADHSNWNCKKQNDR